MSASQVIVREQHGAHPRLTAYFVGDAHSWDEEWTPYSPREIRVVKEYYRHYSILYRTLLRHLPKDGEIVEAGSGLGFWVALLVESGLKARGLDRSEKALVLARRTFPGLRFDQGDVRNLPYPDASFAGYLSFGVAEHFRDGPETLLREAARVLRPGGRLIVTVPWISPLRRLQPFRPSRLPVQAEKAHFYQYFFGRRELLSFVSQCGFRPLASFGYGSMKTLRDELHALRQGVSGIEPVAPSSEKTEPDLDDDCQPVIPLVRKLFWRAQSAVFENVLMRRLAAHMVMVVAERY